MSVADLRDRVAVVTGAAGNLGRAMVAACRGAGMRVIAVERRPSVAGVDGRVLTVAADLLDAGGTRAAIDAAVAQCGRVDALFNIAGGFHYGDPVHATPEAVWRAMFDLNVMTLVNASAAVVPHLVDGGGGAIVNVSAASSVRGVARMGAYVAAKSAVARLTEAMADELRGAGIAVACVMPGILDTPENRAAMPGADTRDWTPLPRLAAQMLGLVAGR